MAVSESYREFVIEQLESVGRVVAKNMFGGVGLYLDGVFFGLIANDTLYFKVDDTNRPDYEAAGMGPFRPYGDKSYAMQYYEVPIELLEDISALRVWIHKALAVAKRKLNTDNKKKNKTFDKTPNRQLKPTPEKRQELKLDLTTRQNSFNGFSKETLNFLRNLNANNNKSWFEAHRYDYQEYLLKPLQNLVADLSDFMLSVDPNFEIRPAINKTISRIYRDVRFSKDKSPYKSTMWITFKRPDKDWKEAPAYFFEISADSYRYGLGFYSASRKTMAKLREMIDQKPDEFLKAIAFYSKQQNFVVEGEKYKRIINKNISEEIQNWYQRKNLYLVCNRKIDNRFFRRELIDNLISGFALLAPFYHYLWDIKVKATKEVPDRQL